MNPNSLQLSNDTNASFASEA